ncbi:hypothetical protein HJFPF1_02237 [Paramyrothecium foliicola]|nr:hypothetical protein HJFPF1_02237 [Paramyrothecium foliicola]
MSSMLFNKFGFTLAIAPLAAAVPQVIGAQCAADNCLRALRGPSRIEEARRDCAAHLSSTVTPPVVTETEFSTILSTSTVVVDTTVDNTITETAIATVSETATVVTSITSTVNLVIGASAPTKRAEAVIPVYASPCSGAARYTSACSCISASPATTTLVASTTTITIPTTVWATETETSVVTQDVPVTESATTTVTVATTTVTSVTAIQTVTPFYITISDNYGTFYIYTVANNDLALVTNDPARAQRFELASDGTVWASGRTLVRYASLGPQYVRLVTSNRLAQPTFAQFKCSITAGRTLECSVANNPARTWATLLYQSNGAQVRFTNTGFLHATPQEYASNGNPFAQFPVAVSECLVTSHCASGRTCQSGRCQ